MISKYIYIIFITLFIWNKGLSQGYQIRYTVGNDIFYPGNKDNIDKRYQDTLSVFRAVKLTLNQLYYDGYLQAKVLKSGRVDSLFYVSLFLGDRFQWAYLKPGNIPEIMLSKVGFRERFFVDKPFKYAEMKKLFERIIKMSENNGYPFASVGIDSINFSGGKVSAVFSYDKGPLITYDSLVVTGDSPVKPDWLASYLRLTLNKPFDQSTVENIPTGIEHLNFVKLTGPVSISFQNSQATIELDLAMVKSNRIDGIIGFLPNSRNDGGLLVTGQFDLALDNLFNSGKQLNVAWQRLKPLTQQLEVAYFHPNVLGSSLNVGLSFDLLKEDTTYINRDGMVSLNYHIKRHELTFFTDFRSSRLISTVQFENQSKLPPISDLNLNYYGVGYSYKNFGYLKIKRSGLGLSADLAGGTKRIKRNLALPKDLYNDVDLGTQQYRINGSFEYYFRLNRSLVLSHRLRGGKIINDNLYLNDLFRIGGLKTIRGFNENLYFVSDYALSNLELQLYYSPESYLFVFYDQSYIYANIEDNPLDDYPLGVGIGVSLGTEGGFLNLAYALGYSAGQPLSVRLSKFHFGYIAKF